MTPPQPTSLTSLLAENIEITPVQISAQTQINWDVARLDLIHPVISGNKLFKLHYNLQDYNTYPYKALVTFGGAWSNHLVATAYACQLEGIPAIGIVRGEAPQQWSHTLLQCQSYGMTLYFIPRSLYATPEAALQHLQLHTPQYFIIPEGGNNEAGTLGAAHIASHISGFTKYTHIVCAAGTGTTLRGLSHAATPTQHIIGIPVLKIPPNDQAVFQQVISTSPNLTLLFNYARGGYAKHDSDLVHFMNQFYLHYGIPTDIVYTGKAAMAVADLIRQNHFPTHSRILLFHTGGLQGNRSLPPNMLHF